MRKYGSLFVTILLFGLFACAGAMAQTYTFAEPQISQNLIDDDFDVVLTMDNLSEHEDWLTANGYTVESMQSIFESEGILLEAVDSENGRTFILSALVTVDSEMYFDLNQQDEAMRKEFRTSHTNGTAYGLLGYATSHLPVRKLTGSASWRCLSNIVSWFHFFDVNMIQRFAWQRPS